MKAYKYKWGIVVLHYKVMEVTLQCIKSLINIYGSDMMVVVVDNGSDDETTQDLIRYSLKKKNIQIIISKNNLGFSRGNNLGYLYLKRQGCDFIILLNNDVIMFQQDFIEKIEEEYAQSKFDILGPAIIDRQGRIVTSYPQKPVHSTIWAIYLGQITCIVKWVLSFIKLDVKLAGYIANKQNKEIGFDSRLRYENVLISGCCIVFSKEYIKKFDGLNPNTFMYLEEEILFARANKNYLKIVYTPAVKIIHIGEAATSCLLGKGEAQKRRFKYLNQFKSFFVLKEELKKR
ncbi:hypothetical protein IMSAG249_00398 [Lachnospiraceae bacterium]|nr:hypothetical protein IMSAG249_00398 [Lachnospiraceae bacterium]